MDRPTAEKAMAKIEEIASSISETIERLQELKAIDPDLFRDVDLSIGPLMGWRDGHDPHDYTSLYRLRGRIERVLELLPPEKTT